MTNPQFEIHPFNEAFYMESLLNKTRAIMQDVEVLNDIWKNGNHDCKNDDMILDIFQNIILNVAGVSRFFWPSKNKGYYKIRAKKLREVYDMNDSSVLKNRDVRNFIEHFDEKLDDFLNEFYIGKVMPKYVGPITYINDNRIFFRAYFYDIQVFKMFNIEYEIKPIINEIRQIHEILLLQLENGGRFILK